jgi:6-pyruvoyltetrahydropterin/6-carboxytetrahydropterin synthase
LRLTLTQEFYFEAAHTLARDFAGESSRRVHGHTYYAAVTVRGRQDPTTGMILDLAVLRAHIETVRDQLDHRFLDEIPGLGPPTLENLALFIAGRLRALEPGISSVRVRRKASGDCCLLKI